MNLTHKTMQIPDLYGLILVGGQSTRMGVDKGLLTYYQIPQYAHLNEVLAPFCKEVYLSISAKQTAIFSNQKVIVDTNASAGPMGALLSAFETIPSVAWLVVACDMPFLTAKTIQFLAENRNLLSQATAFKNPMAQDPEPLVTIYEPSIYPKINQSLVVKNNSLRRVLQQSDVTLVDCPNAHWLTNVNTPAEFEGVVLSNVQLTTY